MNCRNNVFLIGNLGKDCELRTFDSGAKKASFTLATSQSYVNSKGETVKAVEWHNCEAWGKMAETMHRLLKKGKQVAVQGSIHSQKYQNNDGENRYRTYIKVSTFSLLSTKAQTA